MSDIISSELSEDLKNSWRTDRRIFAAKNAEFNFVLDAAANHENHLCALYLTKAQDALSVDWSEYIEQRTKSGTKKSVWVNPPYGRGFIKRYMQKAIEQKAFGVTTVMLVPATLDAQWLPLSEISEIQIVTGGRLTFHHPITGKGVSGNTKGSMFVVFSPSSSPLVTRYLNRDELTSFGEYLLSKAA